LIIIVIILFVVLFVVGFGLIYSSNQQNNYDANKTLDEKCAGCQKTTCIISHKEDEEK
jgi:1,4-dihydroxy-2-naphthoate octaprenyltransferase